MNFITTGSFLLQAAMMLLAKVMMMKVMMLMTMMISLRKTRPGRAVLTARGVHSDNAG